jgi:predicted FMN-binding regulatory protein PaiB
LPQDRSAVEGLLNAIVVFRLKNLVFEAKFKLNQRQSAEERRSVADGLKRSRDGNAAALAALISTDSIE